MIGRYAEMKNKRKSIHKILIVFAALIAVYAAVSAYSDYAQKKQEEQEAELEREKKMQKAVLEIKKKFGKNAILKGMNLEEGSTAVERNNKIGGHRA